LATVLCLIQSLVIRFEDNATYNLTWDSDPFFIASLILNLTTVFIVITLYIIHKLWWEQIYVKSNNDGKK